MTNPLTIDDFSIGDRVIYVPLHANGNRSHPDCESGIVSSKNDLYVFVRFDIAVSRFGFDGATAQSCKPDDLIHE